MGNSWLSTILPPAPSTSPSVRAPDSFDNSASNTPLHNNISSPLKPVNLLPDMPVQHGSRRLTDKEQKDCDVIGELSNYIFIYNINILYSFYKNYLYKILYI